MFTKILKVPLTLVLIVALLTGCTQHIQEKSSDKKEDKEETTVSPQKQSNLSILVIEAEYVELPVGSSVPLWMSAESIEESNQTLVYHSSDESIVTVTDKGILTGVSPGDATVEVSFENESKTKVNCRVHVVSEGMTMLYPKAPDIPTDPDDPDTEPDAEPETSEEVPTEDNIPIEYDGTIPVEVIPEIDEFIWTIKIDHLYEWVTQQGELMLKVVFRLQMTGTKVGGKTPYGEYAFKGGLQSEFPEAEMDAFLSQSGGKVTTAFNPNYTIEDFTMSVTPMDAETYAGEQLDTVRKAMLKAGYNGMSLGTFTYHMGGSSGATMITSDSTQTSETQHNKTASFPYKLKVSKSGFVFFQYETKATQNNIFKFEGKLYKTPILPK